MSKKDCMSQLPSYSLDENCPQQVHVCGHLETSWGASLGKNGTLWTDLASRPRHCLFPTTVDCISSDLEPQTHLPSLQLGFDRNRVTTVRR